MGSASALVIGPDVEAQLAPYKHSDECCEGFYYFWWEIGPRRYESWTDWLGAFQLKPGFHGEAKYVSGDQPPGITYSAKKGEIDFDAMRREVEAGAGLVWDFSRDAGLPRMHVESSSQAIAPEGGAFDTELAAFLDITFADKHRCQFANLYFLNRERLHYSRERYIEVLSNYRIGQWTLIVDGNLVEADTHPEISSIEDPLLLQEAWLHYVTGSICAVPEDTLISQVWFKQ